MKFNSAKNQKIKEKFVEREVVYCVSELISELIKGEGYFEELYPVCCKDDWDTPAEDFVYGWERKQCEEYLGDVGFEIQGNESVEVLQEEIMRDIVRMGSTQEFCEEHGLDPYIHEAFEHWVVSRWLARKLEGKGEMVVYDFLGLTIWGRTTTGQAIFLDGVISEICNEMGILEGQENEWKV